MLNTDSFYPLVVTARDLLYEEREILAANLLVPDNVDFQISGHNNWNGGIDFYVVVVKTPTKLFASIKKEGKVKVCEDAIIGALKDVCASDESIQINSVIVQPSSEVKSDNARPIVSETTFWTPGYFRVFISHHSSEKERANKLKEALKPYGMSCFVAHEDIDVTASWHDELIKALDTMDCLIALLCEESRFSDWCDQEVGFGLGRNVLCIPLNDGINPYGFLGKYQAYVTKGKTTGQVVEVVRKAICYNEATNNKYQSCIIDLFLNSSTVEIAKERLDVLKLFSNLNVSLLSGIRSHFMDNSVLNSDKTIKKEVNQLLKKNGISPIDSEVSEPSSFEQDLPF